MFRFYPDELSREEISILIDAWPFFSRLPPSPLREKALLFAKPFFESGPLTISLAFAGLFRKNFQEFIARIPVERRLPLLDLLNLRLAELPVCRGWDYDPVTNPGSCCPYGVVFLPDQCKRLFCARCRERRRKGYQSKYMRGWRSKNPGYNTEYSRQHREREQKKNNRPVDRVAVAAEIGAKHGQTFRRTAVTKRG